MQESTPPRLWRNKHSEGCRLGRPFSSELSELKDTYGRSRQADIAPLAQAIGRCADLPLLAVGSGGSLSAASYLAGLHGVLTGGLGTTMTPLELSQRLRVKSRSAIFFLSASGRNPDIVNALRQAALSEPTQLVALCMRSGSKVASLSERLSYIDYVEFETSAGKDGFLATNSLLATSMLLYRAYRELEGASSLPLLPKTYGQFMGLSGKATISAEKRKGAYTSLWEKDHLIVLHGPSTSAAAIDLESKFTEAALGTVQIADYRNFAHGRHHWLAKRAPNTAVLAFASEEDRELAHRTQGLLPPDIPNIQVQITARGALAGLCALNEVLYIVASAGDARGIDPGRPGVPPFGRKLYHMSVGKGGRSSGVPELSSNEAIAISRKAMTDVSIVARKGQLQEWREAYDANIKRLRQARFGALILDYDGTLCGEKERFSGIGTEVTESLTKLLDSEVILGIATGRGESVRKDLRKALPDRTWENVVVGYHNGAEVGMLCDAKMPRQDSPDPRIRDLCNTFRKDFRLRRMLEECKASGKQASFRVKPGVAVSGVYDLVIQALALVGERDLDVYCSAHSVDVLTSDVSKMAVHAKVSQMLENRRNDKELAILCIGDRGRFPGNDVQLLNTAFSLSVDQASPDPATCWNLAPPGILGIQAMMWYLGKVRLEEDGRFRANLPQKRGTGCRS